jgi:membrane dipeptidase
VATHSAAHHLVPYSRNLTDRQLDAIRESDGMVGVNFQAGSIRPDGRDDADTPLDFILRQIEYLVERLGIDRVGFGSDFDGATMPQELGDVSGLPRLIDRLRQHGFDEESLAKLAYQNWLRVIRNTWKGPES